MRTCVKCYIELADYELIRISAKARQRSVSSFLVSSAMAEISRNKPKMHLDEIIRAQVLKMIKDGILLEVKRSEGDSGWDLR